MLTALRQQLSHSSRSLSAAEHRDAREWSVAEAMRTAAFYALAFCFAFGMLAQSAFLFHQAPFLEATVGLMGAASIVSVTTLSGLVGRVGFILVGDRMTPRAWCAIVFACQAAAFLILALAETPLWLTLGSALFGLTMGLVDDAATAWRCLHVWAGVIRADLRADYCHPLGPRLACNVGGLARLVDKAAWMRRIVGSHWGLPWA